LHTGRHGFLYNYSESSKHQQTIHILHSTNHFDALLVNNPSMNLQYTQQLAQSTSLGDPASPIQFTAKIEKNQTIIPDCHKNNSHEHNSRTIGKRKLPPFIKKQTTSADTMHNENGSMSNSPQFNKQTLHYGHKGITTKRRRLFETTLDDTRVVQGDSNLSLVSINTLDEASHLLADILNTNETQRFTNADDYPKPCSRTLGSFATPRIAVPELHLMSPECSDFTHKKSEVIYGLRREKLGFVGATIDHVHRLGIDCFQYFPPFSGSLNCLYIGNMVT
jgi:hypothetical protein